MFWMISPEYIKQIFNDYTLAIIFVVFALAVLVLIVILEIVQHVRNSEKMKYEFITIIAHKFQTPLSQIKWIAENIKSEETSPYTKENIGELQKANENLINLTGTLIEMTDSDNTAKSAYNFERIDLCDLLRKTADSMKNIYKEKNIAFSVSCAQNDIAVSADKTRLEFVIQTILNNAFNYTPTGKSISASIDIDAKKAVLSVRDDGIGIAKDDMSRIGKKFFRGHNSSQMDTEGFGVSLYLADTIIRRHKGIISISSGGVGMGTIATITLPRAK